MLKHFFLNSTTTLLLLQLVHEQLHTEEHTGEHTGRGQYHWLNLAVTHWLTVDAVEQMHCGIVTTSTSSSSESGSSQSTP